jgi:CrcB protein
MFETLIVALGAGLGGALRHGVNGVALRTVGTAFPYGTLFINVAGSFAMGLVAGWFALRAGGSGSNLRLFLATGVLGGFTTFSAYSLEVALLYERGEPLQAALYALGSVVLAVAGLFAGLAIVRQFG